MRSSLSRLCLLTAASTAMLGLAACDDDDTFVVPDETDAAVFDGALQPLNAQPVTGSAEVAVDESDDLFSADVDVFGAAPSISHAQHVHADAVCPSMADDANGDGFVDVVEGLPSYGGILTALDDDLSEQAPNTFPSADAAGEFNYDRTASLDAVVSAVRGEDEDIFVELGPSEDFAPATRTVVVHGVDPSTELPETVQSIAGLPAHATLPVACAELDLQTQ